MLKAGAGYVPLDSQYPEDRLEYMLEDSRAAVVITQHRYAEKFATRNCCTWLGVMKFER